MKSIDFTKPGGFPLTQDQLDYLQAAYTESVLALAKMGGDGTTPFAVSGMEVTSPSAGSYNITDGWLLYNSELIRFTASAVTGTGSGLDPFIVISTAAGPLTFNDGSTPNVIFDKTADLQALPSSTPTDADHFPLSALGRYGTGFGQANREASWNSLTVATAAIDGGVTGTVYYKKDFTANTLHIRGSLTANNAQNFAASPGAAFSLMGTFPTEFRPATSVYFTAYFYASSLIKDDIGVGWIKQINCIINPAGQLLLNWIKPDSIISSYGVNFNCIFSLD